MNGTANIPQGPVSPCSPVWRYFSSPVPEQLGSVMFVKDAMSQHVTVPVFDGGRIRTYTPDEVRDIGQIADVDPDVLDVFSHSSAPTLLMLHADHTALSSNAHVDFGSIEFKPIFELILKGFPTGETNIVYSEGTRTVAFTAEQLRQRNDLFVSREWESESAYTWGRSTSLQPVDLAGHETPFGHFLRVDDFDEIDTSDLMLRISEDQLYVPGSEGRIVKLPTDEINNFREDMQLSEERCQALIENGYDTFIIFGSESSIPRAFVEPFGHTPINITELFQQWLQPEFGDRLNVIYFERDNVYAATFEELAGKVEKLFGNTELLNLGSSVEPLDRDEVIRPHDLNDDQVDQMNAVLSEVAWIDKANLVQIEMGRQWVHRLIVVPREDFEITSKEALMKDLDDVSQKLTDVFDGSVFVMRMDRTIQTASKTIPYESPDKGLPGLGL